MYHNFIAIEGNIGSGKTTLAKKISKDLKGKLILEQFSDNPFLPKFYRNPKKYAFSLELFFMAERFQQLRDENITNDLFNSPIISDYAFFKSKLFAQNNLRDDELILFNKLFSSMFNSIRKPDLIVYLHSNINRIQQNINQRGREYEKKISSIYLKDIEKKYFDNFKKQSDFQTIIFDVSKIDFVKEPSIYSKILSEIEKAKKAKNTQKVILI